MTLKENLLTFLAYITEVCLLCILALIYWRLVTYRDFPPPPSILGRMGLGGADGEKALNLLLGDCLIWLLLLDALALAVTHCCKRYKKRQSR